MVAAVAWLNFMPIAIANGSDSAVQRLIPTVVMRWHSEFHVSDSDSVAGTLCLGEAEGPPSESKVETA